MECNASHRFFDVALQSADSTTFLSVHLQCIFSLPNRILKRCFMKNIERSEHPNIYVHIFYLHIHENGLLAFIKELNQKTHVWSWHNSHPFQLGKGKRVSVVIWCGSMLYAYMYMQSFFFSSHSVCLLEIVRP